MTDEPLKERVADDTSSGSEPPRVVSYQHDPRGLLQPPTAVQLPAVKKSRPPAPPLSHIMEDLYHWLNDRLGSESYGAPRTFDLFTLLAITLAFALMFAFLRLIQPLLFDDVEVVAVTLGLYVTGIALFQLAIFGGNKPRMASVLAGPLLWLAFAAAFSFQSQRRLDPVDTILSLACSTIFFGPVAGYLAGAMVAGVFLVADLFRKKNLRQQPAEPLAENDDFIFAADEAPERHS